MRIAVIGSGISGSLVARLLHSKHEVTLFEAGDYAGGHANTVSVEVAGRRVFVDTGFMVFNETTYPNFCRLLRLLDVTSQASDMSLSISCDRTGLEYQGSSLNGLFAKRSNLITPSFYQLLFDIARFNGLGTKAVVEQTLSDDQSVGDFLNHHSLGGRFCSDYLLPMTAAIWSGRPESIMDFPARFLLGFCHNHGLMRLRNRPKWRTIVGGSREYLQKLLRPLGSDVRLCSPVDAIRRTRRGVEVLSNGGTESFDQVVLATHADQSLNLLADATEAERSILSQFPYQPNDAVLHTDTSQLPSRRRAWASWNYRISAEKSGSATVTYDLNRLQRLGLEKPLLLTLNPVKKIEPATILQEFRYYHPAYSFGAISAQRMHGVISGRRHRTHFCGAYWGYGFHEDGVNSALAVSKDFEIGLESCIAASTKETSRTAVSCP